MPEKCVRLEDRLKGLMGELYLWGPTLSFETRIKGEQYFCEAYLKYKPEEIEGLNIPVINIAIIRATKIEGSEVNRLWYLSTWEGRPLHKPGPLDDYEELKETMRNMMLRKKIVTKRNFGEKIRPYRDYMIKNGILVWTQWDLNPRPTD